MEKIQLNLEVKYASIVEDAEKIIDNYIKTKVDKTYQNIIPKKRRKKKEICEQEKSDIKKTVISIFSVMGGLIVAIIITSIIIGLVV